MRDSILGSVKKLLGVSSDYDVFDRDLILYINAAFSTLHQLGLGPKPGFAIEDDTQSWVDFVGSDDPRYNAVKSYVYIRARLLFDPPGTSFLLDALNKQREELEWRLNVVDEGDDWGNPTQNPGGGGQSGLPGPQGPPGPQGIQGPEGPPGPPGATGKDGDPGAPGPRGLRGKEGPQGERGYEGPQGVQGPQGAGLNVLSAVPTFADLPALGNNPGDAHLTTDTSSLWIWGTDGDWHELGHIQGPQGPQGIPGPPGDPGSVLPQTEPLPGFIFKPNGIQSAGEMTFLGTDYIVLHNTDQDGDTHQWATSFVPGDAISVATDSWTWLGEVASINTAVGSYPQQMIDLFVAQGLTLIHPTIFPAQTPVPDSLVEVGEPPSGLVLTMDNGLPVWLPPQGGGGPSGPIALDDLTDVDVHLSATGMMLTKQIDGSWKGANFSRPLNWLSDVLAPSDAEGLLGTTAPGAWEPIPMDHIQQRVVGPLPGQVSDLDARVSALEATPEPVPADHALTVDNYAGGFTRIIGAEVIGANVTRITLSLATVPGPSGAIFNDLAEISGSANVWADFGGNLGRVEDAMTSSVIHGAALKEIIRRNTIVLVHRDDSVPGHPTLKVDGTESHAQSGTTLTLAALADVDDSVATASQGKLLGATSTGQWGPVEVSTTTWYWGRDAPNEVMLPLADENDFYIDTNTGDIYVRSVPTTGMIPGIAPAPAPPPSTSINNLIPGS